MKAKIKVTVHTRLKNEFVSVRTFYCKTQYIASKLVNEYAVKENTVNIEMEEIE